MNLRWLAPEVYETAIVNKSTDVYAFGVTMYETFTVPYSIPYPEWDPEKVYDKVVVKGYRVSLIFVVKSVLYHYFSASSSSEDAKTSG